jgi:hypothetical protein
MRSINGLLLLLSMILLPLTAPAQTVTATLTGTVSDQNGALVFDVGITVSNAETGLRRQVTTSDGFFSVPLLPPGKYTLTVRRQGFATLEVNNVALNVNDQLALRLRLQVGQISESVMVDGAALIQTESPAVGTVINRQFVENLPLNGRSFHALIELTPGTVLTKGQGQFSINGQRDNANYFSVDGVSANIGMLPFPNPGQSAGGTLPAFNALGGTSNLVSVDALQEFRIQTSTYAAEFGRTPGGQVEAVTRAGTNQFRGTLFDYFRNDALDANDWFANSRNLHKPPLRQNDFGGVLGGPIRKDRTFFFFSYEGLRLRQPQVAIMPVPSIEARQAAPAQIQPLLKAFPLPNGMALGDGVAEFSASYSDSSTLNATSIRIDHQFNGKISFFGRYNDAPSELAARGGEGLFNNRASIFHTRFNTQTLTLGATQTFGSRISNDLRANYSRNKGASLGGLDDFGGATPPADSALFPPFASRRDSAVEVIIIPFGFFVGKNVDHAQRQFNLVDNLAFVTGPHQLKFGGDYRGLSPIINPWKYTELAFFHSVSQAFTGNTDFIATASNSDRRVPLFTNFSAYGQDTWKASPRLTVTFGLRWELNPPPSEKHGKDAYTVNGLNDPATMTLAPRGTPLWQTAYNSFAPRVGAAYLLSQEKGRETVLRGGFGIFYDLGSGPLGATYAQGAFGYGSGSFLPGAPFPPDPAQVLPPPVTIGPRYGGLFVFDPRLKLPRVYQGNVAVEQSLGEDQTISATYVAALGRRLLRGETFVSPNPNFFSLFVVRNAATSDYHALQLQFKRRLSHGLAALASYTWSHSLDGVSDDVNFNLFSVTKSDPKTDRGPSDFDVRQSFSAAFTYDLPSPMLNRLASDVLRGWSLDAIFRARSATPVNVTATQVILTGVRGIRPDVIPGIPLYVDDPAVAGGRRINRAAFAVPSGRQGNLGRNALRGFPMSQIDMAVRRQFNFGERLRVQVRADFFNILNHPNFADPEGDLGGQNSANPDFGQSLTMLGRSLGGFNPLYQIGGPRSVQLALKIHF